MRVFFILKFTWENFLLAWAYLVKKCFPKWPILFSQYLAKIWKSLPPAYMLLIWKKITKLYMKQSIQGWSRSKTCGRQPWKNFLGPFLNTLFYIFMKCNPGVRLKRNKSLSQKNWVSNLILCIWSKSSKNVFYHRNYFHLNLSVAFRSKFLLSSSERF